jgi:hypothetical protein
MGVDPKDYVPQQTATEKAYLSYRAYLRRLRIKCPDFETFTKMTGGSGSFIGERRQSPVPKLPRVAREGGKRVICD